MAYIKLVMIEIEPEAGQPIAELLQLALTTLRHTPSIEIHPVAKDAAPPVRSDAHAQEPRSEPVQEIEAESGSTDAPTIPSQPPAEAAAGGGKARRPRKNDRKDAVLAILRDAVPAGGSARLADLFDRGATSYEAQIARKAIEAGELPGFTYLGGMGKPAQIARKAIEAGELPGFTNLGGIGELPRHAGANTPAAAGSAADRLFTLMRPGETELLTDLFSDEADCVEVLAACRRGDYPFMRVNPGDGSVWIKALPR